jgi:hypothetical protein
LCDRIRQQLVVHELRRDNVGSSAQIGEIAQSPQQGVQDGWEGVGKIDREGALSAHGGHESSLYGRRVARCGTTILLNKLDPFSARLLKIQYPRPVKWWAIAQLSVSVSGKIFPCTFPRGAQTARRHPVTGAECIVESPQAENPLAKAISVIDSCLQQLLASSRRRVHQFHRRYTQFLARCGGLPRTQFKL